MFTVRARQDATDEETWGLEERVHGVRHQAVRSVRDSLTFHSQQVDRLLYYPPQDKYLTFSRDGSFKSWGPSDVSLHRSVDNGKAYITDCAYMPLSRKIAVSSVDRSVSFYEGTRSGGFELCGRVFTCGDMGTPNCMTVFTEEGVERLLYGDTDGAVVMLQAGPSELPARDLVSTDVHKDYVYLHRAHSDWVTRLLPVPDIGLVSSSLDSTIKIYDTWRQKVVKTCSHHEKAVHDFVYSNHYGIFVSVGLEREAICWQGNTQRRVGELKGHASSIVSVCIDDRRSHHVFTLGANHVIKMWDLRTLRCVKTIGEVESSGALQNVLQASLRDGPSAIAYDHVHSRLLTASRHLTLWDHVLLDKDTCGHKEPVVQVLYNPIFGVVITGDEGGHVMVWDASTGQREVAFVGTHPGAKMTSMSFDYSHRRLLTTGSEGSVKLWNFHNGHLLREFRQQSPAAVAAATADAAGAGGADGGGGGGSAVFAAAGHKGDVGGPGEMCAAIMEPDDVRACDAVWGVGWGGRVLMWLDYADEPVVTRSKPLDGHVEDVQCMAALPAAKLLATGDYDGRINLYSIPNGDRKHVLQHKADLYESGVEALLWIRPAVGSKAPPQTPRTLPAAASSATNSAGDATRSARTLSRTMSIKDANPLLLSAGSDGPVRVWQVSLVDVKQVGLLPGPPGALVNVSAMAYDEERQRVALGDSSGNIVSYNLTAGVDTSSSSACVASFVREAQWSAHESQVSSLAFVPDTGLLLSASTDSGVAVWTSGGGLVGRLGMHTFDVEDRSTWQDPEAAGARPPGREQIFLRIPSALERKAESRRRLLDQRQEAVPIMHIANVRLEETKLRRAAEAADFARQSSPYRQLKVHELNKLPVDGGGGNAGGGGGGAASSRLGERRSSPLRAAGSVAKRGPSPQRGTTSPPRPQ